MVKREIKTPKYLRPKGGLPGRGKTFYPLFGLLPEGIPSTMIRESTEDYKYSTDLASKVRKLTQGKKAKFVEYKDNQFWYSIGKFIFSISIDDASKYQLQAVTSAELFTKEIREILIKGN